MYFKKIDKQLIDKLAIESLEQTLFTFKPGLTNGFDDRADIYKKGLEFLKGKFADIFVFGGNYSCVESSLCFDSLRQICKITENKLLDHTNGISTFKGALFSLGLMTCAAGKLDALGIKFGLDYLITTVSDFARHYSFRSFINIQDKTTNLTNGEKVYLLNADPTIRGSAEEGFSTVLNAGLNFLSSENSITSDNAINFELYTRLYILLASILEDSGIIIRNGIEMMSEVKSKFLELSNSYSDEKAKNLDLYLRQNNIHPNAAMTMTSLCLFTVKLLTLGTNSKI